MENQGHSFGSSFLPTYFFASSIRILHSVLQPNMCRAWYSLMMRSSNSARCQKASSSLLVTISSDAAMKFMDWQ